MLFRSKPVLDVLKTVDVHAICHVTGGGFDENIPRVLSEEQGIEVIEKSWVKPPIFDFLEKKGNVNHREMFNIYNMGIGMVLVVDPQDQEEVLAILAKHNELGFVIGKVTDIPGVNILLNE